MKSDKRSCSDLGSYSVFGWIPLSAMDYHRIQCVLMFQPNSALLLEVCAAVNGAGWGADMQDILLPLQWWLQPVVEEQASYTLHGGICLNLPVEFTRALYNSEV